MGNLILHIGIPKTGTTSLQLFLFKNREKLESYGIDYPVFMNQPGLPSRARNGIFLDRYARSVACNDKTMSGVSDVEENLARLEKALSSHNKVVLTNEELARPLYRNVRRGYEYDLFWNSTARILEDAGATDVTIVVYLRRQDDWAASKWRQDIKWNHEEQTLDDYCSSALIRCSMDYAGLLAAAERSF